MMGLRTVYQKQFSCKISFTKQASRENFLELNYIFKKPGAVGLGLGKVGGNSSISVGGRPWESGCVWRKGALVKLVGWSWGTAVYLQEGKAAYRQ